mgnify:CR=1 FL=1
MPSPFPGMDPFIEALEWQDFHTTFNTVLRESLAPAVRPRYLVRVERRIYVEHAPESDADSSVRIGDVAIVESGRDGGLVGVATAASGTTVAPIVCEVPMLLEHRESYLVIRERESSQVVTVIETLSPSNKRRGSDGRREYLAKREEVIRSQTHLVELDLLRSGDPMPLKGNVPTGDYRAVVSRASLRPRADVYAWPLWHPLPEIQIPLNPGDDDVPLNLQSAFETVYERAAYELSVDYNADLDPPLSAAHRELLT